MLIIKKVVLQNGCQKWKEHDEINKIANFDTAEFYIVVLKFEKFKGFVWLGSKACYPAIQILSHAFSY